ncbi:MAG: hypothetical protein M1544_02450 [Candidatus Marsarchaeota archaeon]|nr:hypothetical protein [Candidatus Marsarchaeota archaeon]
MAVGNILIDKAMKRYGVPEWVKPYIYAYIKSDPINAVKQGISFVDVKRKRGRISGSSVELPNSTKFDIADVIQIVGLFYNGEEEGIKLLSEWSKEPYGFEGKRYSEHFAALATIEERHLRAIRNMLEGLGKKSVPESESIKALFQKVRDVKDWKERIVAYDLILKTAYGGAFGSIFYKVFYPVMPEYMRSFGKAFSSDDKEVKWGKEEADRIISSGEITNERLMELFGTIIPQIVHTVDANMDIAKRAGIFREVNLLKEIAIAYPMHLAADAGAKIDADKEAARLLASLKDKNRPAKE